MLLVAVVMGREADVVSDQDTPVSDATPIDCANYTCFDQSLRRVIL